MEKETGMSRYAILDIATMKWLKGHTLSGDRTWTPHVSKAALMTAKWANRACDKKHEENRLLVKIDVLSFL